MGRYCQNFNHLSGQCFHVVLFIYVTQSFDTCVLRDQPISKILPEEDRSWFLYALCQQLGQPEKGVPMQTVRVRLRVHQSVFAGSQLVDWLVENGKAADRYV